MYLTFVVLKLDKSSEVKDEQDINVPDIYSTFEVSKLDIFRKINE